jgi:two-component system sensor histidine kinase CpxA
MADRIETLLAAERRLLLDISHELRSPLARLSVAVELARSDSEPERHLDRIEREVGRLNALVGELLQVTRAEGDAARMHHGRLALDELVNQVVEDARLEAGQRGSEVAWSSREPVEIEGDEELIRRAVENVVRNSVRYAPADTAVEVSVKRSGGEALVIVRDHGPGVPSEHLSRIFDPFYRVEPDRNRASGGAGLGLAIARRAIELHHGRIEARNASPGLLVEMRLPVERQTLAAASEP